MQTRLKKLNVWERFLEKHGRWYKAKLKLDDMLVDEKFLQPFSLKHATSKQVGAIESYMRLEGKTSMSGFMTWMRWNEKTFYDILKEVYKDA